MQAFRSDQVTHGKFPFVQSKSEIADKPQVSPCPACGDHIAVPLLDEQHQPLATLAWPKSRSEAEQMKRLPLSFVRCVSCGHVYNHQFRYEDVPYSLQPNLMFNKGIGWSKHIDFVCNLLIEYLAGTETVVEIGCGAGELLAAMARLRPEGRYIGFDPNAETRQRGSVEFRGELFVPERHLVELKPQLLVSRHVLEHMVNPLGFLQSISLSARLSNLQPLLYTEVPCIDRVFENGRVEDFYYEHNSHFTTESYTRMLLRSNSDLQMLVHNYNREVVSSIVRFGRNTTPVDFATEAASFKEKSRQARQVVGLQLQELHQQRTKVALWGGTGKGAAFMNYFGVDADRFPLVVDSDVAKVGTHVPGMGQKICSPQAIAENKIEIVIIPTQWRAKDIVAEMRGLKIDLPTILIEHQGKLVDYFVDRHPY